MLSLTKDEPQVAPECLNLLSVVGIRFYQLLWPSVAVKHSQCVLAHALSSLKVTCRHIVLPYNLERQRVVLVSAVAALKELQYLCTTLSLPICGTLLQLKDCEGYTCHGVVGLQLKQSFEGKAGLA